jgi:hypothetical protein
MSISSIPAPQEDKPKPRFIFLEKSSVVDTYESFQKEGFAELLTSGFHDLSTHHAKLPYEQEMRFLSAVDLTKGPILVSVKNIIRTMAVDHTSPKRESKEVMFTLRHTHESEGKFTQQTKDIKTRLNPQTGEHIQEYHRGVQREAYKIPWDKKKANELLTSEKIFGEDSLNITNLAEVQYIVKFPAGNPGRTAFGMQDFLDFKYEKLQELSRTVKSPYLADLERRVNPYK